MSGRGGFAPRGRGGFQAKKWVKPGTAGATAAPAAVEFPAAAPASHAADEESMADEYGGRSSPHLIEGAYGGRGGGPQPMAHVARKWVKGQETIALNPATGAATEQRPSPPERGRLSVFVGNLDPSVAEDNLWRFFSQAGYVMCICYAGGVFICFVVSINQILRC